MKIVIHKTLNRSWGPETPYTVTDDDGIIYNGFLPLKEISEEQIIDTINAQKAKRIDADKVTVSALDAKKADFLMQIVEIDKQKAELQEAEAVK